MGAQKDAFGHVQIRFHCCVGNVQFKMLVKLNRFVRKLLFEILMPDGQYKIPQLQYFAESSLSWLAVRVGLVE